MIDYDKFLRHKDDKSLLEYICLALSDEYLNEVHLIYKKSLISIEPVDSKVAVFYNGSKATYNNVEELFLQFFLDGKPFIERISEIDYE